jgi:hypothetical protein
VPYTILLHSLPDHITTSDIITMAIVDAVLNKKLCKNRYLLGRKE